MKKAKASHPRGAEEILSSFLSIDGIVCAAAKATMGISPARFESFSVRERNLIENVFDLVERAGAQIRREQKPSAKTDNRRLQFCDIEVFLSWYIEQVYIFYQRVMPTVASYLICEASSSTIQDNATWLGRLSIVSRPSSDKLSENRPLFRAWLLDKRNT